MFFGNNRRVNIQLLAFDAIFFVITSQPINFIGFSGIEVSKIM